MVVRFSNWRTVVATLLVLPLWPTANAIAATPDLRVQDAYAVEGDTSAMFRARIEFSAPAGQDVVLSSTLSSNTAVEGSDFLPVFTGQTVIPAGSTGAWVDFQVLDDSFAEPDETFFIDIDAISGATVSRSHAVVTIFDNDGGVPQAISDQFAVAGDVSTAVAPSVGVLFDDFDPAGGSLSASLVTPPSHGSLTLMADGGFTYLPFGGFRGADAFVYRACSTRGTCAKGVASLSVGYSLDAYDRYYWNLPSASDEVREGFLRLSNRYDSTELVTLWAIDDAGQLAPRYLQLALQPFQSLQLNSHDLEAGNTDKGLVGAFGPGTGSWTVFMTASDAVRAYGYLRTSGGFLTTMHDRVAGNSTDWFVPVFNPAENSNQVSTLRLTNLNPQAVSVVIDGIDDTGHGSGYVSLYLPAQHSALLSANDLEQGNPAAGLIGKLGNGTGKWRLHVSANGAIAVQSLLTDPSGYVTNLSRLPNQDGVPLGQKRIAYLPRASNTQQQGVLRVSNTGYASGTVTLTAIDDAGHAAAGPITFTLPPHGSRQFTSQDLEAGNPAKATGQFGAGTGDWRLVASSVLALDVMALVRTPSGFLTTIHDVVAPGATVGEYDVPTFNPASNGNQASALRITNPTAIPIGVRIDGYDDDGFTAPRGSAMLTVGGNATVELSSADLEGGNAGKGLYGQLGDGAGKWRLHIAAPVAMPIVTLLRDPNGNITNLSTDPEGDSDLLPQ